MPRYCLVYLLSVFEITVHPTAQDTYFLARANKFVCTCPALLNADDIAEHGAVFSSHGDDKVFNFPSNLLINCLVQISFRLKSYRYD